MIKASLDRENYSKWTEVSLGALRHNLQLLSKAAKPAAIMGVVKANAYGHNVSIIAPALYTQGVRHFGIATLAEGIYLKPLVPGAQILVLGALLKNQYLLAIREGFHFLLHTPEDLPYIDALAAQSGARAQLHLKIDTGMGRVGVSPEQVAPLLEVLPQFSHLDLVGVCTHFATSDRPNCPFMARQIQVFEDLLPLVRPHLVGQGWIHAANSDAIIAYPQAHYNLVRPGISLYGYGSYPPVGLRPVLALKAQLAQVKMVPSNTGIGYGRSFVTRRTSQIGIIPAGYADGITRLLSNQQDVLVRGQRCPLVGRVSMDQAAIDLTDLNQTISAGEEIVLIGRQGELEITAQEWADKLQTIPYEVLTSLGTRLPRFAED